MPLVAFLILGSVAHAGLLDAVKQRGTLRIAVEGTYPPFNFKEKGQLAGFEVELAKALASKMGVKDAAYRAVPSLSNSLISLIKDTSLVSVIAVSELMLATREAIATTFQPFPLYIAAAAIYWAMSGSFEGLQKKLELRLNRSYARCADQAGARYPDSEKPALPRSGRWLEPA